MAFQCQGTYTPTEEAKNKGCVFASWLWFDPRFLTVILPDKKSIGLSTMRTIKTTVLEEPASSTSPCIQYIRLSIVDTETTNVTSDHIVSVKSEDPILPFNLDHEKLQEWVDRVNEELKPKPPTPISVTESYRKLRKDILRFTDGVFMMVVTVAAFVTLMVFLARCTTSGKNDKEIMEYLRSVRDLENEHFVKLEHQLRKMEAYQNALAEALDSYAKADIQKQLQFEETKQKMEDLWMSTDSGKLEYFCQTNVLLPGIGVSCLAGGAGGSAGDCLKNCRIVKQSS